MEVSLDDHSMESAGFRLAGAVGCDSCGGDGVSDFQTCDWELDGDRHVAWRSGGAWGGWISSIDARESGKSDRGEEHGRNIRLSSAHRDSPDESVRRLDWRDASFRRERVSLVALRHRLSPALPLSRARGPSEGAVGRNPQCCARHYWEGRGGVLRIIDDMTEAAVTLIETHIVPTRVEYRRYSERETLMLQRILATG